MLKSFVGDAEGDHPCGALVVDGTTLFGATHEGTVFKMNTDGTDFTVIRTVEGGAIGELLRVGTKLCGATPSGGRFHFGSLYSMNLDGSDFRVLHEFAGGPGGSYPNDSMTLGGQTLYGATLSGGPDSRGTLFRINVDGTGFQVLHQFSDGRNPNGNMVLAGAMLYGATSWGGEFGNGTLFKIDTNGGSYVLLRSLATADGTVPRGGLTRWGDTLHGTTFLRGSHTWGVVYSLSLLPAILKPPQSRTAEVGAAVRFSVRATPPVMSYQ